MSVMQPRGHKSQIENCCLNSGWYCRSDLEQGLRTASPEFQVSWWGVEGGFEKNREGYELRGPQTL